uniref:Uncharacterized protein n=1 Tax=Monopterus albus TaxID=43700 RepID=A0A3Q3KEQ3_MONAL
MASFPAEDFSCPICSGFFKEPVLLLCSHSFCKVCLQSWWKGKKIRECPVCRVESQWSDPPLNLALKNLCEAFLQERVQMASLRGETLCHLHSEKLKLFCLDHQQPVCIICRDAKIHVDHKFRPINEAVQDHREELEKSLKPLQEKLNAFNEVKINFNQTAEHIKVQTRHTERQIREQFKKLHRFLQEEEKARINALREEEEQKSQMMTEKMEALSREIAALSDTVRATEKQLSAEAVSFLPNYKATMNSVQQWKHLGNLTFNIWNKMKDMVSYTPVILDPNTANSELILSEDLTSVRHGKRRQHLPDNPERFEYWDSVLGSGFQSGTHSWDVKIGDNKEWELGVLAESVSRQEFVGSTAWSVQCTDVGYRAYSPTNKYTALPVTEKLSKIRVHLDWKKQVLSFSEPDTNTHIHTFIHAFTEKLYPYLCTRDAHALKILPNHIRKQWLYPQCYLL